MERKAHIYAKVSHRFRNTILMLLMSFLCVSIGFIVGVNISYENAYLQGATEGYNIALADVASLLQQKGITLDWVTNTNGSYTLTIKTQEGSNTQVTIAANLIVELRDKDGNLKDSARGAGTFTDLGKNWTVAQLSNIANVVQGNSGINASQYALYLSDTEDATGITAASSILPNEITTDGLERAIATTYEFSSTGVFTAAKTKTATGTISPLCWGLNYAIYDDFDGNSLIAYDSGPGVKNMVDTDTLTETWTVTIT